MMIDRAPLAVAAALAVLASVLGGGSPAFLRAYLLGWVGWLGVALGALSILCLHHLAGGRWGVTTLPLLTAATRTLAPLALLFLPIALGLDSLYPWTDPGYLQAEPVRAAKAPFLDAGLFLARSTAILVAWSALAGLLARARRPRPGLAAFIIVVYFITVTIAAVDWVLSLDPNVSTSAIGIHLAMGNAVAGLAAVIVAAAAIQGRNARAPLVPGGRVHDLGTLLLAALMLWAYIALSQFIILWMADLPHQAGWLLWRTHGRWAWVGWALVILHFVIPFFLLLFRAITRDLRRLALVAGGLLVMRFFELAWLILPASENARLHWLDIAVPLGLGALWILIIIISLNLRRGPLLVVAAEDVIDV